MHQVSCEYSSRYSFTYKYQEFSSYTITNSTPDGTALFFTHLVCRQCGTKLKNGDWKGTSSRFSGKIEAYVQVV